MPAGVRWLLCVLNGVPLPWVGPPCGVLRPPGDNPPSALRLTPPRCTQGGGRPLSAEPGALGLT